MVLLDRPSGDEFLLAVNSNHVCICSSLAEILNAKLLPTRPSPMCTELPYHKLSNVDSSVRL